jgi:hypothetical protein
MAKPTFAQSQTKPIPEFILKFADHSYDVPPTVTSTTDPYTNKTTTRTIAGYHVDNKTIDAEITNNGGSYYNFRYKPHYTDNWSYYPFNPDINTEYIVPSAQDLSGVYAASTSSYTTVSLTFLPKTIPENGVVDVQVQALFGSYEKHPSGMRGAGFPTYDFIFSGESSNWSNTQTVTMPSSTFTSPSPSPTVPEFPIWLVILPFFISLLSVAVVLRHRKTAKIPVALKLVLKSYNHGQNI